MLRSIFFALMLFTSTAYASGIPPHDVLRHLVDDKGTGTGFDDKGTGTGVDDKGKDTGFDDKGTDTGFDDKGNHTFDDTPKHNHTGLDDGFHNGNKTARTSSATTISASIPALILAILLN